MVHQVHPQDMYRGTLSPLFAIQRSFTDQHEHRLMVFPEDVLEAARQRCPGADAAADADAAAVQDVYEATGLPAAYSKASFCKAYECK